MNKFVIVLSVIMLLSIGAIFTIYFIKEKPAQENILPDTHNVSIKIFDNSTGDTLFSYYALTIDNNVENEDVYFGKDYLQIAVPINNSFTIYTKNISDCYYDNSFSYPADAIAKNIRVDIPVNKCGKIALSHSGNFLAYETISVNISVKGIVQYPTVCLHWSNNILSTSVSSIKIVDVPDRLSHKTVKCYEITDSLIDTSYSFVLEYSKFRDLLQSDFIEIYLIDAGVRNPVAEKRYSDAESNDIYISDVKYVVK